MVAINANDGEAYPEDGPDRMQADALAFDFTFDYLVDETQNIARAYDAACTPDFFLLDGDRKLEVPRPVRLEPAA